MLKGKKLYLVTDEALSEPLGVIPTVEEAIRGGVHMVQLRDKTGSTRKLIDTASALLKLTRPAGVPLLINDRVDVALATGADGVHIGQSDMPYPMARKLMGPKAIIGLSIETRQQLLEANQWADLDYVALSPVYPTSTKKDIAPAFRLAGIHWAKAHTPHYLVGIGGLGNHNISSACEAGLEGIAVVSAICGKSNPRAATQELIQKLC
ncbi:MAG: thiamine phosphate synthase [Bacteroidota bacterium]